MSQPAQSQPQISGTVICKFQFYSFHLLPCVKKNSVLVVLNYLELVGRSKQVFEMARKCCAPLCSIDESGGVFTLFELPSNANLRKKWLDRLGMPSGSSTNEQEGIIYISIPPNKNPPAAKCFSEKSTNCEVPFLKTHQLQCEYIAVGGFLDQASCSWWIFRISTL